MAGPRKTIDAARTALERARDDLERRLDAEPAWAALKQLEARLARGEAPPGVDYDDLKLRLYRHLDAKVADWRSLAAVEAAIVALGVAPATIHDAGVEPSPVAAGERLIALPPPLPEKAPPRQVERTRYGPTTSRPLASKEPVPQSSMQRPGSQHPRLSREPTPPRVPAETVKPRRPASAGSRLASALGLAGDGPARLTSLEAEIERMMRRDVGIWEQPPGAAPSPSARSPRTPPAPTAASDASGTPSPRRDSPSLAPSEVPMLRGDEAEVEIVSLAPAKPREEPRPISRLAERLRRVDDRPEEPAEVSEVVMQGPIEEASVEIVLLDEQAPVQPGGSTDKGPSAG